MSLNERINKIKITLFGNVWIARIVKALLYLSVILVAWLICISEYLFSTSPWGTFKTLMEWEARNIGELSNAFFTLTFAGLLIFAYFCLISWLTKWLLRINISPRQQTQILQKKVYKLDEKITYSVEKLDNLEMTAFRNSTYSSLEGTLSLDNQKQKKMINFICNFSGNLENLETNFPQADVKLKSKKILNWKIIVLVILLPGSVGYLWQIKEDATKKFSEYPLGQIMKGRAGIQKQIEKKKQEEKEAEEKKQRYQRAKITDPNDIDINFRSIGGLKEAVKECEANANSIRQKNIDPKKRISDPQHILLYGPSGTGKTMLARAMAKHSGSFFLNLNGNDFSTSIAQELGNEKGLSSEEKIRTVFNIAVQEAGEKTIVALIDEIDQMSPQGWREIGREFQNILDDTRYKNIIIVATTNHPHTLSNAFLRPGRVFKKLLISYPETKEIFEIIKKVLGDFHDERYKEVPELFGNLSREAFINKFAESIWNEMKQSKYEIKYGDMGAKPGDKLDPEKGRILFTGADVWNVVVKEAPQLTDRMGRRTLRNDDFVEAIKKTYEFNRKNPRWLFFAEQYLIKEIRDSKNQDDERRRDEDGGPGRGPRF